MLSDYKELTNSKIVETVTAGRSFVMGVAMVVIMLFHQSMVDSVFLLPFRFGYWGVDVFLFLSGIGIAFSLNRTSLSCCGCLSFYGRRLRRVFPAALVAGWCLFCLDYNKDPLCLYGMNLWYVRSIMMMYLAAPLLFSLLKRENSCLFSFGIACICWLAAVVLLLYRCDNRWIGVWTLQRLPSFLMGLMIYRLAEKGTSCRCFCPGNERRLFFFVICCVVTAAVVCYVKKCVLTGVASGFFGLAEFAFIALATPGISYFASLLGEVLPVRIKRCMEWVGRHSLELYLVHECVFTRVVKEGWLSGSGWGALIAAVMVSGVLACFLKKIVRFAEKGVVKVWTFFFE